MMQEYLHQLLQSKSNPDVAHLPTLVGIRKKYPYCSLVHVLEAIHAANADKGLYQEMLRKAAVFTFSRAHLRALLKNKPLTIQKSEDEVKTEEIPFTIAETVSSEKVEPFTFMPIEPEVAPRSEFILQTETEPISEPVQEIAKPALQYIQLNLIDKFIESEPRIKPRNDTTESGANKDLTAGIGQWDEEIVSETLAIVLLKQKKFQKAIDMYEKLKLKFPEKTAYFAALIENIKKLIDSKTEHS